MQRVIAGYDAEDPYSRAAPFDHLRRGGAARAARIATAETVDISLFLEIARLLYDGPWVAERTAALRDVVEAAAGHSASGHAHHSGRRPDDGAQSMRSMRSTASPRRAGGGELFRAS